MKRILYLFITLLFVLSACDDAGDGSITSTNGNLRVIGVTAPSSFSKTLTDSTFSTSVRFDVSGYLPEAVWVNVKENVGADLIYRNIAMHDNGSSVSGDQTANDGIYTTNITMSELDPSGSYNLEYFYSDENSISRKLSVFQFKYDNGQNNLPPEIVNIIAPDSILIDADTVAAIIAVEINDVNGLRDVEEVWFTTTRPNGTSSGTKIALFDSGADGDQFANDGIYSRGIIAVTGQTQGDYKFNFRAKDKAGNLSEIITHTITIVE